MSGDRQSAFLKLLDAQGIPANDPARQPDALDFVDEQTLLKAARARLSNAQKVAQPAAAAEAPEGPSAFAQLKNAITPQTKIERIQNELALKRGPSGL